MSDTILPVAIIIAALITAAFGGAVVGYILRRKSRSNQRRALLVGLVVAAVSPILHGATVFVWAGLLGVLAGYFISRFIVSQDSRDDM